MQIKNKFSVLSPMLDDHLWYSSDPYRFQWDDLADNWFHRNVILLDTTAESFCFLVDYFYRHSIL